MRSKTATPIAAMATVFHALSDETRLLILEQLKEGEQCVCDLTGTFKTGQSRLSFHLRVLKDAGLVLDRPEGRWVYYSLNPETLENLQEAVNAFKALPHKISRKGCCL